MSDILRPTAVSIHTKLRFWLTFTAGFVGFSYIMILGGFTFRGIYEVQLAGLILFVVIAVPWLGWRWWIRRVCMPRTGLEWVFGLGLLALILSLWASPDPRQGLWRAGWTVGSILLFYFFINILNGGVDRWGLLASAVATTGLVLFQADVETLQWYRSWWDSSGGFISPPVAYRFTGLLTASTPLMALANLFLPVMLLAVLRVRQPVARVLAGTWVVFYLCAVPFSSSRGGWLGMAVALAAAFGFWIIETRPWRMQRRSKIIIALSILVLLAAAANFIPRFLVAFASHSSHGGDPFGSSGREVFWQHAVEIWQTSPVLGVGPGRFPLEYLRFEPNAITGYWPPHAHSTYFQILAEAGLLGLAVWIIFLVGTARWGLQQFCRSAPQNRALTAAILAGLLSLPVELVFDELTGWLAVTVPAVFLLAWIGTNSSASPRVFRRVSLGWLAVPTLVLINIAGWSLWAYQPFIQASSAIATGNWQQAAQLATQSADRDPSFHFYHTQAGLLWASDWQARKDPASLSAARRQFAAALQLEPNTSWNWANLAVLDSAAGETSSAFLHIQRAIQLSPNFSIYSLNQGIFYEQAGQNESALAAYRKSLDLQPEWSEAAFWQQTSIRRAARSGWVAPTPAQPDLLLFWQQARSAIADRRYDAAARLLAQAHLLSESALQIAETRVLLAQARGDPGAAWIIDQAPNSNINLDEDILNNQVAYVYNLFISYRTGAGFLDVPGLIPSMEK